MTFYKPYRLEVTDGTTTIDLANGSNGFWVDEWRPSSPEYKGDGVFQDSPLATGRRLAYRRFTNVIDTISIRQSANTPDAAIRQRQELKRLFEKAADYGTTGWQETPVYLVAQGIGESNLRYALIVSGRIPDTNNPYGPQFNYSFFNNSRSTDQFDLVIEHGLWLDNPPESGTAVLLKNEGEFDNRTHGPKAGADNLDYIYFYDSSGGTYSSNFAGGSYPATIMPSGSTVGDAIYFGNDTKFFYMSFFLSSGQNGTSDTTWEYWDGSSWTSFLSDIVKDTTGTPGSPGQFSLQTSGTLFYFDPPSDWRKTAVNGVTTFWVRMRLTGTPTVGDITFSDDPTELLSTPTQGDVFLPFVANHQKIANLTDVYYYSDISALYGDNILDQPLPVSWFSGTVRGGDLIYFGIDISLSNSGPFSSIVFNLDSRFSASSYTATWQYWDGSSWRNLDNVYDNTDGGSGPLSESGVNGVHWQVPSNWATTSKNGVTAYWVRLNISAASSVTLPDLLDYHPYTVSWSYIEVVSTAVAGDIRALIQMKQYSEMAALGRNGVVSNRFYVGERSTSRGSGFVAWLNFSDEQNPTGVTASVNALWNSAFADDLEGATGRVITLTAGASDPFCRLNFASTVAADYQGEFRLILRAKTSDATGYGLRAEIRSTEGDELFIGDRVTIVDSADPQMFNMGRFSISDLEGGFRIRFTADPAGATTDLTLFDLFMMPVDEWAMDSLTNEQGVQNGEYLETSSLGKRPRSIERNASNDTKKTKYRLVSNGEPSIQSNETVRFWFAFENLQAVGSASNPDTFQEYCARIELNVAARYLSMRGDR